MTNYIYSHLHEFSNAALSLNIISSRVQLGCVEVVGQETDSRVVDSIGILINEVNNKVQLL